MKVVIFGLGSIGVRHAKILLDNFECELFAYRSGSRNSVNNLGIKEVFSWEEIKNILPDIAFITNPTYLHIKTALQCASLGMHLFIEKPLSHSLDGIDLLESICVKKKLTCYVAYSLRFHPVIKKILDLIEGKYVYHVRVVCSSYLPDWRERQDYKKSYSASIKRGGGVLLDLSHEFDYIKFLFGQIKDIKGVYDRISEVTDDAEDFADVLITTDSAINVNLHMNFISLFNERSITVNYKGGYLVGDLLDGKIEYHYKGGKQSFLFNVDRNEYLREQTQYFFENIGNKSIMNSILESKQLLGKILEFRNG